MYQVVTKRDNSLEEFPKIFLSFMKILLDLVVMIKKAQGLKFSFSTQLE